MAAKKKKNADTQEWMYEIISAPHITEKATMGSEHGQVTFRVPLWATKPKVKTAVETLFGVKVRGVNISVLKGKKKNFRGFAGKQSDIKKAVVSLEEGEAIDVGTGI